MIIGIKAWLEIMDDGSTQDLQERVTKLEALLGVPMEGSSSSLFKQLAEAQKAISYLQTPLGKHVVDV